MPEASKVSPTLYAVLVGAVVTVMPSSTRASVVKDTTAATLPSVSRAQV